MVERARLESVYTGNCIGGSNPPLSALTLNPLHVVFYTYRGKQLSLLKLFTSVSIRVRFSAQRGLGLVLDPPTGITRASA